MKICNEDMKQRHAIKNCNKDMQRPYVRQHVFLAGWGSFEASHFNSFCYIVVLDIVVHTIQYCMEKKPDFWPDFWDLLFFR